MKTALITGGCGFIGSHFIRRFLRTHPQWQVVNLDKLTYSGNPANTADYKDHPNYRFVQGDICDEAAVAGVMEGADAVIAFAAETHVDRSIDNPSEFMMTNIFGTRILLEAAQKYGIKRYIHISTDEVYGSIAKGAVDETATMAPNSPYAASKASADLFVRAYWKTYDFPAMIIRAANNYGPYQHPEKVIPLFITNLIEGKKVPLYGEGLNRRDWIYVEDNCAAIELIFDRGEAGQIYNVGADSEKNNLELTSAILKVMGKSDAMIQKVKDRPGHDFRYCMKSSKIQRLGFKPAYSFDKGLKATVDWYSAHKDWWQPLKKDKFTVK